MEEFDKEFPDLTTDMDSSGLVNNEARILIEIDKEGDYVMKQWEDGNTSFDSEGMLFEIFKNN